jgi:hypothetical protein
MATAGADTCALRPQFKVLGLSDEDCFPVAELPLFAHWGRALSRLHTAAIHQTVTGVSTRSKNGFRALLAIDYGALSAHHKAGGDACGGCVKVDDHHVALARQRRRGRQGSQHVACRRFVLDDRVQQSLAGAALAGRTSRRSPGLMRLLRVARWFRLIERRWRASGRNRNQNHLHVATCAMMSEVLDHRLLRRPR